MSEKFEPGLYRHFKGGHYYALCVAHSHEGPPDGLTGGEVVYYSYEKDHWRRRPLSSPAELPDGQRVGFLDVIDRPGFSGASRFRLVQKVPPFMAMRDQRGVPWIPVRPGEVIKIVYPPGIAATSLLPEDLRICCRDMDGQSMTASSARAKLYEAAPAGSDVGVVEGHLMFALQLMPDAMGRRHSFLLAGFERGPDYPPRPSWWKNE